MEKLLLLIIVFVSGSCIGSFLNVVIYRLPNNLSVNKPKRSFCTNCKKLIPFYLNIPILSWLLLRGKCLFCKKTISIRYLIVELITGVFFVLIWNHVNSNNEQMLMTMFLSIFISLIITATFIDIDHYIIPDSITIGGLAIGVIGSTICPALQGETTWLKGFLMSILSALIGFSVLWIVVLFGKIAFGKIHHKFEKPENFEISQPKGENSSIIIKLGEFKYFWEEVFFRNWDKLILDIKELFIDDKKTKFKTFSINGDGFIHDGKKIKIESVNKISGTIKEAIVPREAMGYGDIKFIAMFGAFLGWKSIIFILCISSLIGTFIGIPQKITKGEKWSKPLPFGPYLSIAAIIWIFWGNQLFSWYMDLIIK